MQDLASPAGDLDPIERASADELHALQLERLQWSLRHAYANVPSVERSVGKMRRVVDHRPR